MVAPLLDAVVFELIELAGAEVKSVGRSIVAELFARKLGRILFLKLENMI
jgi:hypothetical protein